MTSGATTEADPPHQGEPLTAPELDTPILIPLQEHATEQHLHPKDRAMLHAFYRFSIEGAHTDPRTAEPTQAPVLAQAARDFVADATHRYRRQLGLDRDLANPAQDRKKPPYIVPTSAINDGLRDYYREFGTNRRTKSSSVGAKEEAYIARGKQKIMAVVQKLEAGPSKGSLFPEYVFALRLEVSLRQTERSVAADSVETLLAVYGNRLLGLRSGLGGYALHTIPKRVQVPDMAGIPPHLLPEDPKNYRLPKRQE